MIKLLVFIRLALRARKIAKSGHPAYVGVTRNGITEMAIFVAFGREAWRISQRAVEEFKVTQVPE